MLKNTKITQQQQIMSTSSSSSSPPPLPPEGTASLESDVSLLMLNDTDNEMGTGDVNDNNDNDRNTGSLDRESTETNIDNGGGDSGSSSVIADDENRSNSFGSTEENRADFENSNLNDVSSTWENFINDNLSSLNQNEEKIYEDLCYVTFSKDLPEVFIRNAKKNKYNTVEPVRVEHGQKIKVMAKFLSTENVERKKKIVRNCNSWSILLLLRLN